MLFQQGQILFHKYRIVTFLGSGAFSQVYLVEHINLNIFRALKCINKQFDSYGSAIKEANILKNLRHPAIPIIYDIEENEDSVCIIEDYIEGMSLNSFIYNNSRISLSTTYDIVLQLCDAVEYLHNHNIYHADIKPDNILFNNGKIYLLDYGNAGNFGEDRLASVGTVYYAPPELYSGSDIDSSSDVYSIGVLILRLVTGSKSTKALQTISSKKLRKLISDCLIHSKKERISSISQLITRIKEISENNAYPENVSLRICFVGAYAHSGTTHCAMLAQTYLEKSGFNTVLYEKNNSNHFLKILRHMDHVKFKSGIYEIYGCRIIPHYYECVNTENLLTANRIIYDMGKLDSHNISFIQNCDIVCLVTGGRPYELDKVISILKKYSFPQVHTLINLTDVRSYKRIIKSHKLINPVRVGYFPIITDVGTRRIQFGKKKN